MDRNLAVLEVKSANVNFEGFRNDVRKLVAFHHYYDISIHLTYSKNQCNITDKIRKYIRTIRHDTDDINI